MALSSGGIAWYDGEGDQTDSINNNDLDSYGGTYESGIVGQCFAIDDYGLKNHDGSFSLGDSDFTIAFWWNADAINTQTYLCAKGGTGSTSREFDFFYGGDGDSKFTYRYPGGKIDIRPRAPIAGTWACIVLRYDASADSMEVAVRNVGDSDWGTATGSFSGGMSGDNGDADFTLGARTNTFSGGNIQHVDNGPIDSWTLYNRRWTDTERDEFWNGGSGVSYSDVSGGGSNPPAQPTATGATNIQDTQADLNSSTYSEQDGDPHQSSDWQVRLASATDWTSPVFESLDDTSNLESITATGLSAGTQYEYRVRHTDTDGDSAWSGASSFTTSGGATQDFWSADDHSVGDTLADLSNWSDPNGNVVAAEIKQDGNGNNYLEIDFVEDDFGFLEYTGLTEDADTEVFGRIWIDAANTSDTTDAGFFVRGVTLGSSPYEVYVVVANDDGGASTPSPEYRLYLRDGGGNTTFTTDPFDQSPGDWMDQIGEGRFRINGSSLEATHWQDSESEPSPQLTGSDGTLTSAGGAGIMSYSGTVRVYEFGIGTQGDAAPSSSGTAIGALGSQSVEGYNFTEYEQVLAPADVTPSNPHDAIITSTLTAQGSGDSFDQLWYYEGTDGNGDYIFRLRVRGKEVDTYDITTTSSDVTVDDGTGTLTVNSPPSAIPTALKPTTHDGQQIAAKNLDGTLEARDLRVQRAEQGSTGAEYSPFQAGITTWQGSEATYASYADTELSNRGSDCWWDEIAGQFVDADKESATNWDDEDPDHTTFDILDTILDELNALGWAHAFWIWGDSEDPLTPKELTNGINGVEHDRLKRYIAARLGPRVEIDFMQFGYDLQAYVSGSELTTWAQDMNGHLAYDVLLEARGFASESVASPTNPGNDDEGFVVEELDFTGLSLKFDSTVASWDGMSTPSIHGGGSSLDDVIDMENVLSLVTGQVDQEPIGEMERALYNRTMGTGGAWTETRLRHMLWRYRMALEVKAIHGELWGSSGDYADFPASLETVYQTMHSFWGGRLSLSLTRDNSLAPDANSWAVREGDNSRLIVYAEGTGSISVDLSGLSGSYAVTSVDTTAAYSENDRGTVSAGGTRTIDPDGSGTSSDWVLVLDETSGITGTMSLTDTGESLTLDGAVAISGSATLTDSGETLSISGATLITGTSALTDSGEILDVSGATSVAGTLALTDAGETLDLSGAVVVGGSLSLTDTGETLDFNEIEVIQGGMALTDTGETLNLSGGVVVGGAIAITDGGEVLDLTGATLLPGSMSVTDAAESVSASGTTAIAGTFSLTDGTEALVIVGENAVGGSLSFDDLAEQVAINGSVAVVGTFALTEGQEELVFKETPPPVLATIDAELKDAFTLAGELTDALTIDADLTD